MICKTGELLNAAGVWHDREEPGLLVVGVAAHQKPKLMPQSRIIVLPRGCVGRSLLRARNRKLAIAGVDRPVARPRL